MIEGEGFYSMCLLLVSVQSKPGYPLILAANRDEYYDRPTAPAGFWSSAPDLLAGRDLRAGGTWLGITRSGRLAAVTNYRDPASHKASASSRGELITKFLTGTEQAVEFFNKTKRTGQRYNGFNLVLGDYRKLYWFSNRAQEPKFLAPGIYGLSNHLLDTPWPKVEKSKAAFAALLAEKTLPPPETFFEMLIDPVPAEPGRLPDTGIGFEWERILSAVFIKSPTYGTRSSTLISINAAGHVIFTERTHKTDEKTAEKTLHFEFDIEK